MYDFSSIDGPLVVFDVPYTHKTRRHIMYVISLSSSRDRRSLIQSLIAAHYVCNKVI